MRVIFDRFVVCLRAYCLKNKTKNKTKTYVKLFVDLSICLLGYSPTNILPKTLILGNVL